MTDKKDFLAKIKAAADMTDEAMLLATIANFAARGHGTPLIIEQAILLVDRQLAHFKQSGDLGGVEICESLKGRLQQALIDGVDSLRVIRGPGPEMTEVQNVLVSARRAAGHDVRTQMKCRMGIIDIYDVTTDEIIECKYRGTSASLGEAAGQVNRYQKSFPGARRVIAVLRIENEAVWLADVLIAQGIEIIEIEREGK